MIIHVNGYSFASIIREWAEGSDRAAYISVGTAEFYDTCRRYVNVRNGAVRAACAITPDGELVSVVRLAGGTSSDVGDAVRAAIASGKVRYLGCFDGALPRLYRAYGFVETDRWPWRSDYAPLAWNYQRDGRPDYLTLTLTNNGKSS